MRTLTTAELLEIWDRGLNTGPVRRALLLLEAACPETTLAKLENLNIGQRNALLLELRALTFGTHLEMRTNCPGCAEPLELECAVAELIADIPTDIPDVLELEHSGHCIRYRLPNSIDLEAIAGCTDNAVARDRLLARCMLPTVADQDDVSSTQLPSDVYDVLVAQMEQADPQADMRLALVCPACKLAWQASFDIVTFFWDEIQSWALRTLRDVHTLALSYGWRETDILALSSRRRQMYLELIST